MMQAGAIVGARTLCGAGLGAFGAPSQGMPYSHGGRKRNHKLATGIATAFNATITITAELAGIVLQVVRDGLFVVFGEKPQCPPHQQPPRRMPHLVFVQVQHASTVTAGSDVRSFCIGPAIGVVHEGTSTDRRKARPALADEILFGLLNIKSMNV